MAATANAIRLRHWPMFDHKTFRRERIPAVLKAIHLECIRGERRLFKDLDFEVKAGMYLFVQGANGSGKTSLLRMLAGLSPPAAGEVRWKGRPVNRLREAYRCELLYCGHLNALKEELSAEENLMATAALAGQPADSEAMIQDALHRVGLKGREDLPVRFLSQGQKRRVNLARLLLDRSALWILDEPFTALDANAVQWLCAVIDAHLQRGGIAVLTSHQDIALSGARHSVRLGT